MDNSYLGTNLDPDDYYRQFAESYSNPHQDAIVELLNYFKPYLIDMVLDLGCGSGLATSIIGSAIGIDRSPEMITRYRRETNCKGFVANFWEELPPASSAMAIYSLHLCPESRLHQFEYRLKEAGIKRLIVISPLKRAGRLSLPLLESKNAHTIPDKKTIWGWMFSV